MMLSPHDVRGIGVGFGGPVDVSRGRVHTSYQVEGWTDFPLAEKLRRSTGIAAVVIENDADTAGLAEARFGAGVGCSPLLYLTIGSGIGGALIVEGQIYRGCGLGAVEIGHMEIPVRSQSGIRILQLEEVASGWGIAREARDEALGLRFRVRNGGSGSYSSARTMTPRQSRQSTSRKRRLKVKSARRPSSTVPERAWRSPCARPSRFWLPAGSSSVAACP